MTKDISLGRIFGRTRSGLGRASGVGGEAEGASWTRGCEMESPLNDVDRGPRCSLFGTEGRSGWLTG